MDETERPSKSDAFLTLLQAGWVSLHLDARSAGVVVPAPFSSQAHLVLQYGRNMPIPIADLEVTEDGVSATLSFSRVSHRTYVPWSAVYAVTCTDGHGVLYNEDVPSDIVLAMPANPDAMEFQLRKRHRRTVGYSPHEEAPWLRVLPPDEEIPADLAIHLHSRRRRPQLRVVK
jgi:stringent starvation protein B